MTHNMTFLEKRTLISDITKLTQQDIIQKEDCDEIYKIIQKACTRTLVSFDDPIERKDAGREYQRDIHSELDFL